MASSFPNESSRLLEDHNQSHHEEAAVKDPGTIKTWREVFNLALAALPIAISFALQNITQAFSIGMVGTLGSLELGVASYGYMFASCTANMLAIGGSTALDTLCGQAITSRLAAENPRILGLYLQQNLMVLSVIFIAIIAPIWVFSGKLFLALGWEEEFAMATGRFLIALLPGGLLQVIAECFKKFLQVQGESYAVSLIIAASSAIGILANYLLIRLTKLGTYNAALAFLIYQLSNVIFLVGFIFYSSTGRKSWSHSTKGLFKGFRYLLFLVAAGIFTVASEWWSFEILALMAARLDEASIGAQSIIMASDLILTTMPLGLGVAISHRIGNLLGANAGQAARLAARSPYILSLILGAIEFIIIFALRDVYGYVFTSDTSIVRMCATILPLMAGFQVLDLTNGGASGILRGAGKNHLAGLCNVFAYYGVGLISGWYMCFQRGLGLWGLRMGIITGSSVLLVLQTGCILTLKWVKLAEMISERED